MSSATATKKTAAKKDVKKSTAKAVVSKDVVKITENHRDILKIASQSKTGTTYKNLADKLGLKRSYLSRIVSGNSTSLLNKGLVEIHSYEPDSTSHQAYNSITATAKGKKAWKEFKAKK